LNLFYRMVLVRKMMMIQMGMRILQF